MVMHSNQQRAAALRSSKGHPFTDSLTDEHLEEFEAMLMRRDTTIDDAQLWLKEKGYTASRSAVDNARRRLRVAPLNRLRIILGVCTDQQLRDKLRRWINRLHGNDLVYVALFAAVLATFRLWPAGRRHRRQEADRIRPINVDSSTQ